MTDASDTLQRLLDDPEVQAAAQEPGGQGDSLPVGTSVLGALPPDLMGKLPALMSALGPMLGKANGKKDEKTALLLALKPFLSPHRQTAVDSIMRVSQLGHILQQLK